jgi:hypothetical protein
MLVEDLVPAVPSRTAVARGIARLTSTFVGISQVTTDGARKDSNGYVYSQRPPMNGHLICVFRALYMLVMGE